MNPEQILFNIDTEKAVQTEAEEAYRKSLGEIGEFITAIAANELSYELASARPLHEIVDLDELAEKVTDNRVDLAGAVEQAISRRKKAFRSEHNQRVLSYSLSEGVET